MKRNTVELHGDDYEIQFPDESAAEPVPRRRSYARCLRALGQALESRRLASVDLEVVDGIYVVRGTVIPKEHANKSFLRVMRDLVKKALREREGQGRSGDQVALRYTAEEIERLDSRGRMKRQKPDAMPDPHSLSQILRGAGSYLDHRIETALVGISIKDRWVTLRYRTVEGRLEQAKQDLEYFYDYWVKMYLQRANRPPSPSPHDPTLIVTWEGLRKRYG
ncbi:MAG TPA: hypothetical protein VNN77_08140 [candidate division Zixibacteria bacterium]|nr:hypothetical protein [candidate division Zixibacteria bacterium]